MHPSGNYLYNSNSDLITSAMPAIEIFDISDFANPRKVTELALPTRPGLGTESHDISFNAAGDRAYSAALSQGVIIDTTNPAAPVIVASFLDPSINVWHQAEPFTLTDATGAEREFLIVEDEVAGAVGTGQCPNGGVHVFDITGDRHDLRVLVDVEHVGRARVARAGRRPHLVDVPVADLDRVELVVARLPLRRPGGDSVSDGAWLTPAQALARAQARPKVALTPRSAFFCLL